jgi:hypothetical protein
MMEVTLTLIHTHTPMGTQELSQTLMTSAQKLITIR